jgi:putative membrane protein
LWALTAVWAIGLAVSGFAPHDRGTWLLEVFPALIVLPTLWWTRHRFAFSTLVYVLIAVHGLILMLGGAYTYARVPLGFWMQDLMHLSRNPYDRVGHFAQGFVPALVAREILLRHFHLSRGRLLNFVVICICLAISAFYELIEWWTALIMGGGADAFLGTQGDPWDTQEDMFMALIAAVVAVFFFGRIHDRAIRAARSRPPA